MKSWRRQDEVMESIAGADLWDGVFSAYFGRTQCLAEIKMAFHHYLSKFT